MWMFSVLVAALITVSQDHCNTYCQAIEWTECVSENHYDFEECRLKIDNGYYEECTPNCCMSAQCRNSLIQCAKYMGKETCNSFKEGTLYNNNFHNVYHVCQHCD